ncbi:MAG: hypothetical protein NKF70_13095 [Methanobacterium sp. ERen5]|nr:MAG: hypothetical protein NKF70_13095 [Methanobacterium sp. ERen5]
MRIENTSIFFMVLLILATLSGPVTAYGSNNSTINSEEDAKDRIKYLESQIESLIKEEEGINFKIADNNKKMENNQKLIKILNNVVSELNYEKSHRNLSKENLKILTREILRHSTKASAKKVENMKLNEENQKLKLQKGTIQKLRGNYSLEMEYLKIRWNIIDPA